MLEPVIFFGFSPHFVLRAQARSATFHSAPSLLMAPKDLKTYKRRTSDARTGSPPPTKKAKCSDSVRRSHRVGKGSGGAAEQLQKVGDVITTVQSKKTRDGFKDAGEVPNPMAPESPTTKRVKKVRDLLGCCVMLTLAPSLNSHTQKTVPSDSDRSKRHVFFRC